MEKKKIQSILNIVFIVLVLFLISDMVFFKGNIVIRNIIPGMEKTSDDVSVKDSLQQEKEEEKKLMPVVEDRVCGDGNCDEGEKCCLDCGCPSGFWCDDMACVPRPYCGDGLCKDSENCANCFVDCKCGQGKVCHEEMCTSVECNRNRDCNDDEPCTQDICYFGGDANAYCGHEKIKACDDSDGCCPAGCSFANDLDCED